MKHLGLIKELCARAEKPASMTPKINSVHYPDITASIAAGDDYKLLVKNGEDFLREKYGSKSDIFLSSIKKRMKNDLCI